MDNKTHKKIDIATTMDAIQVYDKERKIVGQVISIDMRYKQVEYYINPLMSTTKDFDDVVFITPIEN